MFVDFLHKSVKNKLMLFTHTNNNFKQKPLLPNVQPVETFHSAVLHHKMNEKSLFSLLVTAEYEELLQCFHFELGLFQDRSWKLVDF